MTIKLVVAFLLLIGVAFFFTMSAGARRNDSQTLPDSDKDRTSYAQAHPPPAWIGNLVGPLSPKLSLPQKEFQFAAAGLEMKVPAAGSRFRNAALHVTSGCRTAVDCSNVQISYTSIDGEGKELKLDAQTWQPSKDKPSQASLVILQGGGTIRFQCAMAPSCTVELL